MTRRPTVAAEAWGEMSKGRRCRRPFFAQETLACVARAGRSGLDRFARGEELVPPSLRPPGKTVAARAFPWAQFTLPDSPRQGARPDGLARKQVARDLRYRYSAGSSQRRVFRPRPLVLLFVLVQILLLLGAQLIFRGRFPLELDLELFTVDLDLKVDLFGNRERLVSDSIVPCSSC